MTQDTSGRIGEPTLHPGIMAMVRKVKALGLRAEMVTNGTRMDGPWMDELISSGLDTLWVSLDGATEKSYEDIRQGGDFAKILENLQRLQCLDVNNTTKDVLFSLLQGFENLSFMGNPLSVEARRCRFIHDRSTFVRWDGKITPCAGLLHTHRTYLYGLERTVSAYPVGDIAAGDLYDIWNSAAYARFRERVRDFDFSPCHVCGGCSMLEENEEDCYGNTFPVCGGCLWAQGIIQCP